MAPSPARGRPGRWSSGSSVGFCAGAPPSAPAVTRGLTAPERIVLIDDVVTKGATLLAGASLVRDAFPGVQVDCFALVRTLGLQPEVDQIVDPVVGTITRNPWGGADRRP